MRISVIANIVTLTIAVLIVSYIAGISVNQFITDVNATRMEVQRLSSIMTAYNSSIEIANKNINILDSNMRIRSNSVIDTIEDEINQVTILMNALEDRLDLSIILSLDNTRSRIINTLTAANNRTHIELMNRLYIVDENMKVRYHNLELAYHVALNQTRADIIKNLNTIDSNHLITIHNLFDMMVMVMIVTMMTVTISLHRVIRNTAINNDKPVRT